MMMRSASMSVASPVGRPRLRRRPAASTMTDAIAPFSTLSISTGSSQTTSCSPGSGSRPASRATNSPTVSASVGHAAFDPDARALERQLAGKPDAAVATAAAGSSRGALNSSGTLPSSSPSTSSSVISPTTASVGVHDQRLVAAPLAQEREQTVGAASCPARAAPAGRGSRASPGSPLLHEMRDDVLGVQDAGDVVERAAKDRQPAVRARGDDAQHVAPAASRCRSPRDARAGPSTGARRAGRAAARGAAAPAPAARAGRRRGSRRSAARSPRASARAGVPCSATRERAQHQVAAAVEDHDEPRVQRAATTASGSTV